MKPTVPTICLGPSMTWPHLPQTPFHTPLLLAHCTPALLTSLTFRHLATFPSSLQPQGCHLFSSPPGTSSVKLSLAVSSITSRSPLQRYHLRDGFALLLIVKPDPHSTPNYHHFQLPFYHIAHWVPFHRLSKPVIILFAYRLTSSPSIFQLIYIHTL